MLLVIIGWALFVGGEPGVGLGLLLQRMFVPSGGVSALYFLRNYGVLLLVSILCCTSLPQRFYEKAKEITWVRASVLGGLLLLTVAYMVDATSSPFLYWNF